MIELFAGGIGAAEIALLSLGGGSLGVLGLAGVIKKFKSKNFIIQKSKEENFEIPKTTQDFLDHLEKFTYSHVRELLNSDYSYIKNLLSKERNYQDFIKFINENAPERSIFDKFNEKVFGGTFENEYKKYSTVMGETLKSLSYSQDFFGIPVVHYRLMVGTEGKWLNKARNTGASPILFYLTDIDFSQHRKEFNTLKQFEKTINKLEQDLRDYTQEGGNDEEIISLLQEKIKDGEKSGQEIVDLLRNETNELENVEKTEKSLEIFNKAYSVSYNY